LSKPSIARFATPQRPSDIFTGISHSCPTTIMDAAITIERFGAFAAAPERYG
jgi:hypothetical protein